MLEDNGSQFISKFFQSLCAFLGSKNLTTTAYHLETNGHVESFNKTTIARLRQYVADNQRDWDVYVQPLT